METLRPAWGLDDCIWLCCLWSSVSGSQGCVGGDGSFIDYIHLDRGPQTKARNLHPARPKQLLFPIIFPLWNISFSGWRLLFQLKFPLVFHCLHNRVIFTPSEILILKIDLEISNTGGRKTYFIINLTFDLWPLWPRHRQVVDPRCCRCSVTAQPPTVEQEDQKSFSLQSTTAATAPPAKGD